MRSPVRRIASLVTLVLLLAVPAARAGSKDHRFIHEGNPKFVLVKPKTWEFDDLAAERDKAMKQIQEYESQIAEAEKQLEQHKAELPDYAQRKQQLEASKKKVAEEKQRIYQVYAALKAKLHREDPKANAIVLVAPYDPQQQPMDKVMEQMVSQIEGSSGAPKILQKQELRGRQPGFQIIYSSKPPNEDFTLTFLTCYFTKEHMARIIVTIAEDDFKDRKNRKVKKEIISIPARFRFL